MSLDLYIAYVVIAFFTIVSPGAAILLAIHNGLSLDLRAVAISTLGNILGLFILSTVAMFGVGVLLQTSALFFLILKIVGALYLVYLGAKQIFGDRARLIAEDGIEKRKVYDTWKVFKKGFLLATLRYACRSCFFLLHSVRVYLGGIVSLETVVYLCSGMPKTRRLVPSIRSWLPSPPR